MGKMSIILISPILTLVPLPVKTVPSFLHGPPSYASAGSSFLLRPLRPEGADVILECSLTVIAGIFTQITLSIALLT